MGFDERKIEILHGKPCGCFIDGKAIYVKGPCRVVGHHVTKKRIAQEIHKLLWPNNG